MKVRSHLCLIISLIVFLCSIQPVLAADKEEPLPSEETEIKDDATEQGQEGTYKNRREYIQHMMEEHYKNKSGFRVNPDYKEKKTPQTEEQAAEETSPSEIGQE